VKRIFVFSIVISFLLSSCVGNASLWGQYQTPTPIGGGPNIASQQPDVFAAENIPTLVDTPTLLPLPATPTPTSLLNAFITQETPTSVSIQSTPTPQGETVLYKAQSGDWLPALANRFGVGLNEITSPKILSEDEFIDPGTLLIIPDRLDKTIEYTSSLQIIPDSEIVFSATSADFDINGYVKNAGGYLSTYREYLGTTAWTSGADEIKRLSYENSINPRLILALLDYEAQWVRGKPENKFKTDYPMGQEDYHNVGMFGQMTWAVNQLSFGYYGWRRGAVSELTFNDGKKLKLDPTLNAGTVAVMSLFSIHHSLNEWLRIMDSNSGFSAFYKNMFGDAWARADLVGNFFPSSLTQPPMTLPIEPGTTWSYTGGPHNAWGSDGPRGLDGPIAAVDFAPQNDKPGCTATTSWVLAMAPGLVVRSENGLVMVDMDGDGSEQTGWDVMYLHIASKDRVPLGQWVDLGARIGHASCEGGKATGTHVHIARKYNGEWMLADGPIPFVMSGWTVIAGDVPYVGKLVKGNKVVTADTYGQAWSLISRDDGE